MNCLCEFNVISVQVIDHPCTPNLIHHKLVSFYSFNVHLNIGSFFIHLFIRFLFRPIKHVLGGANIIRDHRTNFPDILLISVWKHATHNYIFQETSFEGFVKNDSLLCNIYIYIQIILYHNSIKNAVFDIKCYLISIKIR